LSPRLTNITAKDVTKVLKKLGFELDRQRGSHAIFYNFKNKQRVVVPIHGKTVLKPKALRGILNDLNISPDEFLKLLK